MPHNSLAKRTRTEATSEVAFLRNARFLAISQMCAKLLPFLLHAIAARAVPAQTLRVPLLHFALVQSLVQAPRDGIRRALLRLHKTPSYSLCFIPCALGTLVCIMSGCLISFWKQFRNLGNVHSHALALVALSSTLELLAEPAAISFRRANAMAPCASAEATTSIVRSLSLHLFLYALKHRAGSSDATVMAYAASEACACLSTVLAYGIVYCLNKHLLHSGDHRRAENTVGLTTEACRTCAAFVAQDCLKLALSESEKLVVVSRSGEREQGGFGLASNLGAIFARCVLKPVEDAASSAFSDCSKHLSEKARLLQQTLHHLCTVSMLVALVAQPFVPLGLFILYGQTWTSEPSAVRALRSYCAYIPFLALNGVVEAFADALLSVKAIAGKNAVLVLATALQVLLQLLLEPYFGAIGIVSGNCMHMLVRCMFNIKALHNEGFLVIHSFTQAAPRPSLLLAAVGIAYASSAALVRCSWMLCQIGIGALALLSYTGCAFFFSSLLTTKPKAN